MEQQYRLTLSHYRKTHRERCGFWMNTKSESLREMVEREMRVSLEARARAVDAAIDVAVRLVRRWGHALGCQCCRPRDGFHTTTAANTISDGGVSGHRCPYTDPRCAPPVGSEGKVTT